MNKIQSDFLEKCETFAVKCEKLRHCFNNEYREYQKADQIARSSSSIGALYSEALYAESEMDYIHKLSIAQKECSETIYWLKVLRGCEYVDEDLFCELNNNAFELMRYITAVTVSLKRKNNKV